MSNYGNDSIRALSDKEAMRLRPANNLGSDDVTGAFQTLKEVVDNSIDELKAGYGSKVVITKHKDKSYSVQDSGRGVPMAYNSREEKYNYELVFMTLNSGGKYNTEEDGTFEYPKGANGIGNSAVAFTSDEFFVVSHRDNKKYTLEMFEGEFVSFTEEDSLFPTGTYIKWRPDLKVFKENNIPFEWIIEYGKEQAVVNKRARIVVIDEDTGTQEEFYYEEGIQDYIKEVSSEKELSSFQYFEIDTKGKDREDLPEYRARFEVAFVFNNDINMMDSYHNSSYLKHGGSPRDAVRSSFAYAIHRYVTDNNLYKKKEKRITWDDIEDSLIIISNTYSMQTSYANQTKLAITNEFIKDFMNEWLREQLEIYFTENPKEAKIIAEQVLINKRSSETAEEARLNIKKKLSGNINSIDNKIEGFYSAKSKDKSANVLTICEGKSALSAILAGRQSIHAIFPLRGKVLNCLKAPMSDVVKNEIIMNLMKVIGAGIEVQKGDFDVNKMNFDKIVIYVDRDEDGIGSIFPLLLTAFYRLTPTLIKEGKIYLCETPLYEIVFDDSSKEDMYALDDEELEEIKKDIEGQKYKINYVKGLAELSHEAMALTLREDYPNIVQVRMDRVEESFETLDMFMGSSVEKRKKIILDSFKDEVNYIE